MASGTFRFFVTDDELLEWINKMRDRRRLYLILEHFWPRNLHVVTPNQQLDLASSPNRVNFCVTQPNLDELLQEKLDIIGYWGGWSVLSLEPHSDDTLYMHRLSYSAPMEGEGPKLFRFLRSSLKVIVRSGVIVYTPGNEEGVTHNTLHYSQGASVALARGAAWKYPGGSAVLYRPAAP